MWGIWIHVNWFAFDATIWFAGNFSADCCIFVVLFSACLNNGPSLNTSSWLLYCWCVLFNGCLDHDFPPDRGGNRRTSVFRVTKTQIEMINSCFGMYKIHSPCIILTLSHPWCRLCTSNLSPTCSVCRGVYTFFCLHLYMWNFWLMTDENGQKRPAGVSVWRP